MAVLVKLTKDAPVADTRNRMIEAAVRALQHDGVAGMSFTDVLRDSGAARGAIYHHFPGGKDQLVAEAAARNGDDIRAALASLPTGRPLDVVKAFLDAVRPVLAESATGSGCAVAAVTVGDDASVRSIAARAFASWTDALAERLRLAGLRRTDAADLAGTLIMLLEGAHVLCRAAGTLEPFEQAARQAITLTRSRYGAPHRPRSDGQT
jgi:AcrR family transcriptional regulator